MDRALNGLFPRRALKGAEKDSNRSESVVIRFQEGLAWLDVHAAYGVSDYGVDIDLHDLARRTPKATIHNMPSGPKCIVEALTSDAICTLSPSGQAAIKAKSILNCECAADVFLSWLRHLGYDRAQMRSNKHYGIESTGYLGYGVDMARFCRERKWPFPYRPEVAPCVTFDMNVPAVSNPKIEDRVRCTVYELGKILISGRNTMAQHEAALRELIEVFFVFRTTPSQV